MPGARNSPEGELEDYLRREIPLSRDMGVRVASLDGKALELAAPLAPNRNHKGTAFGGSLYSLATLAAWGTVRALLAPMGPGRDGAAVHIVIVEGALNYLKPVQGAFAARCERPDEAEAARFRQALLRKGKARIALRSEVRAAGAAEGEGPAAVFQGVFAASLADRPAKRDEARPARGRAGSGRRPGEGGSGGSAPTAGEG
jgi:thioesterase domain-containing protein